MMAGKAKRGVKLAKAPEPPTIRSAPDPLDGYINAAAKALDLPLRSRYRAGIKANLAVTMRLAASVSAFALPDEAEPAPVFKA